MQNGLMIKSAFFLLFIACISSCQPAKKQLFVDASPKIEYLYPDSTMTVLTKIFDSINFKSNFIPIINTVWSRPQSKAHYIELEHGNLNVAIKDMISNMPFDLFLHKHKPDIIEKERLVYGYFHEDSPKTLIFGSNAIEDGDFYYVCDHRKPIKINDNKKGKWFFQTLRYSDKSKIILRAFYFTQNFTQMALPNEYAFMKTYSNCLIDNSINVYNKNPYDSWSKNNNEESKVYQFKKQIEISTGLPFELKDADYLRQDVYLIKTKHWDSIRNHALDSVKNADNNFMSKLIDAIAEAKLKGGSDDEFEFYVGRFYSKYMELELKRNRIKIGFCSYDNSGKIHIKNIAQIAADLKNWKLFLNAHFYIINNRIQRMSDSGRARAERETNIEDLEAMHINIIDLLIGLCIETDAFVETSDYNNFFSMGKALEESMCKNNIKTTLIKMIEDKRLDDLNRMQAYNLMAFYVYKMKEGELKTKFAKRLLFAAHTLPEYLLSKLKFRIN